MMHNMPYLRTKKYSCKFMDAKDDRGDPTEYGFLLIGRSEGLLQLYFIPVFIYTFIKVKSK